MTMIKADDLVKIEATAEELDKLLMDPYYGEAGEYEKIELRKMIREVRSIKLWAHFKRTMEQD